MSYHPAQPGGGSSALKAFRQARWRADVQQLWARLTGQSTDLLCYFEVRDLLLPEASFTVGRQTIPLANIVGSVERCTDFTHDFLPRKDSDLLRWARVKEAVAAANVLPPIRVYRVDEVYFVIDGNHRVSVARQLGWKEIEAHVVHIQARVPLAVGDRPAEVALKHRHARFLDATALHRARPEADLTLATPEQYSTLQAEIEAHRVFLTAGLRQDVPPAEAAADWYDRVYLPVVQEIRRGLLPDLAGWTEACLYLALRAHRLALAEALGQEVSLALAAADLAPQLREPSPTVLRRVMAPARSWARRLRKVAAPWKPQR